MDTITVLVGSVVAGSGGQVNDTRRPVEFAGEELGTYREYGEGRDGVGITDTRGVTETLYKAEDGRLIVHVKDWSNWQGEPTTESVHEVTAADLGATGQFSALGLECGYGRPLTLEEVLGEGPDEEAE